MGRYERIGTDPTRLGPWAVWKRMCISELPAAIPKVLEQLRDRTQGRLGLELDGSNAVPDF